MTFNLDFLEVAFEEWNRLDDSIKVQFKKKLLDRLEEPRVSAAKLTGHPDRYKIKLSTVGYRLVYEVKDDVLVVLVIAVCKRDKNAVFKSAESR